MTKRTNKNATPRAKSFPRKTGVPGKITAKVFPKKTGVPGKLTAKVFTTKTKGLPGTVTHKGYRQKTGNIMEGYFSPKVGENNVKYIVERANLEKK